MYENTMKLRSGLNFTFPTPIEISKIEITDEIVLAALERNEIHNDLYEAVWPAFDQWLWLSLGKELNEWKRSVKSWINRYDVLSHPGMPVHTHRGSQLSAIVVIESGTGGEITFQDPRGFAGRGYDDKFAGMFNDIVYQPEQGDVIVFPSYIYHGVRPTKGLRITAAFDCFLFKE